MDYSMIKGVRLSDAISDYVVLDLETTGLRPDEDDIIEIGAVKVSECDIVDTFSVLVKPNKRISPFITDLTGISNSMVKNAPTIEEVLPQFLEFVGQNVVIGHNVTFDLSFLRVKCNCYLGVPFPNDYMDTLFYSRRLFPLEKHHKLCDLEQRFGLHNDQAHRALSDVLLTRQCYEHMKNYAFDRGIDLRSLKK